jgi:hypothetical protein
MPREYSRNTISEQPSSETGRESPRNPPRRGQIQQVPKVVPMPLPISTASLWIEMRPSGLISTLPSNLRPCRDPWSSKQLQCRRRFRLSHAPSRQRVFAI